MTGVQGAADLDVYVGAVHASWQINPWLALVGSYQFNLQRGIAGAEVPEVTRDVALLRLVSSGPGRGGERVP